MIIKKIIIMVGVMNEKSVNVKIIKYVEESLVIFFNYIHLPLSEHSRQEIQKGID